MHQAGVAGFQRKRRVREIVRGHALQHGGGGGLEIDVVRDLHQHGRRHHGVLRIGAAGHRVGHAVAGRDFRDALADCFHRARAFAADRDRRIGLVQAGTEVDVDEVDAAGGDAHQRLSGAGLGHRHVHQLRDFPDRLEC